MQHIDIRFHDSIENLWHVISTQPGSAWQQAAAQASVRSFLDSGPGPCQDPGRCKQVCILVLRRSLPSHNVRIW